MTKKTFESIMGHLIGTGAMEPLVHVDVSAQFHPEEQGEAAIARNLNASFLIALSGRSHPLYEKAILYLNRPREETPWKRLAAFYAEGLTLIPPEIQSAAETDGDFADALNHLQSLIARPAGSGDQRTLIDAIQGVFFPEGAFPAEQREEAVMKLREKRTIRITGLCPRPVKDPAREILFTANILLTLPPSTRKIDDLQLSPGLRERLKEVVKEDQVYWYDHPIQMGVEIKKNEAVYGLRALDGAVAFEKQRGTIDKDAIVTCVLSVSVTHRGLQGLAKAYLEEELKNAGGFRHLAVYLLTEANTRQLTKEVLAPAARTYRGNEKAGELLEIIGVDGEYGKHYSFLKAISAFWQVLIDPAVKGTFKIDLDQVFPQQELVDQTGASAFEHFKSPLWGAEGVDHWGDTVELGMIAGALVNEKDICNSVFCPDVPFPTTSIQGDEYIFSSALPQALSTEAEMMTRYSGDGMDGKTHCIQRVHVTGGTNGILVPALRKYRPFTPTFIGRAEDQAYLLSVLFTEPGRHLRYVHGSGLIMRHDKEAFAAEAIEAAHTGKMIGDYVRILLFSYYARALPWPIKRVKDQIDPFSGCFVSRIPFTIVYLRLALKAARFFQKREQDRDGQGFTFLHMGAGRLGGIIGELKSGPKPLAEQFKKEQEAWDIYYDVLDRLEKGLQDDDAFVRGIQEKARKVMEECRVAF